MIDFFKLPTALQTKILSHFSTRELFELITGLIKPQQIINDSPQIFRYGLFMRRGEEASRHQSSLLGSWLKHWASTKKLSFIKSHQDKKIWLSLLDAALKDPHSSFEHKMRCCLFINRLYPNPQDITPLIIQTILINNQKNSMEPQLKSFGSELSQVEITQMIARLLKRILTLSHYKSIQASISLASLIPFLNDEQKYGLLDSLMDALAGESDGAVRSIALALESLASFLSTDKISENQTKKLAATLSRALNIHKFLDWDSVAKATSALAPYLNDDFMGQTQPLFNRLFSDSGREIAAQTLGKLIAVHYKSSNMNNTDMFRRLQNHPDVFTRCGAALLIGVSAAYQPPEARNELFQILLGNMSLDDRILCSTLESLPKFYPYLTEVQKNDLLSNFLGLLRHGEPPIRDKASGSLGVFSHYLSINQKSNLLTRLVNDLQAEEWPIRQTTIWALEGLLPALSHEQREPILATLVDILNDDNHYLVSRAAARALSASLPFLSIHQKDRLFNHYLKESDLLNYNLREGATYALMEMVPYCTTPEQTGLMLAFLYKMLGAYLPIQDETQTMKLLGKLSDMIPTDDQIEHLYRCLLEKLNDKNQDVRQSSAEAMCSLAPYLPDSLLRSLLDLPGQTNFEKLSLKLLAHTRLLINQINRPDLNPGTQYGVYFERNNPDLILEKSFNKTGQAFEHRTLRFWSKADAMDDCVTAIPNKHKLRWNEV